MPGRELMDGAAPKHRTTEQGRPGIIVLSDRSVAGTCLHCPDTPCVHFNEDEIASPVLTGFPFNRTREVCPFGALSVDSNVLIPIINNSACVGCGLCVSRCPSNALYTDNRGTVSLNDTDNEAFKTRSTANSDSHADTVRRLNKSPRTGSIRPLEFGDLEQVMSKISAAQLNNTNQKLLVRNLLLCLGAKAAISTVGDTNLRIDMWWETAGVLWVTEVDFDLVSLVDSPRNLLDDVAVCVSRHGVRRDRIGAMIINMEFPNKRSDYYHLIEDIKKVAELEIRTLPVAALLLSLWNHSGIQAIDLSHCVATRNDEDSSGGVRSIVNNYSILRSRYFCATK